MKKVRIDKLLLEKELAGSRQKAAALCLAGCVFIGDKRIDKPGQLVAPDSKVIVKGEDHPYVSRGGMKLAHALEHFALEVKDLVCMDVGASTGGFTDCLLQNGAKKVYAVDVGYGQIAWKLVNDERVVVIERTNIRTMGHDKISEEIKLVVVDVSFISLALVLPVANLFLGQGAGIVALVKPQFEVGKDMVGKGGIVRDPKLHLSVVDKIKEVGIKLGWDYIGHIESPIFGAKGNKEFLIHFRKT